MIFCHDLTVINYKWKKNKSLYLFTLNDLPGTLLINDCKDTQFTK